MNKYIRHIVTVLVFQFVFVACYKCHEKQYPTQTLSDQDLNINPYSGNETLIFSDSSGESIIFIGSTRKTNQLRYFANDSDGIDAVQHNCFGDYYYCDVNSTVFDNTSTNDYFKLDLLFSDQFKTKSLEKIISFAMISQNPHVHFANEGFCFDADSIFNSSSYPYNNVIAYFNSYKLGNQIFNKVYKLRGQSGNYFFYSIKDGLLGFVTNKFILFTLQKK